MIELYRSENLLVRSLPAKDLSRWVVTFDNYGIGHGFDRAGFGQEFLKSSGISAIHVMGAREDWYQYPDIFEALATVKQAVAGAERVMTYGSSMGAYAALRFADAVGANAVLALSPQYSINPEKAPFEYRWTQDAARIAWQAEIERPLSMKAVPVVVFDPLIEDGKHVKLIAAETPIHAVSLPRTGHPTSTALAEAHLLKPLVFETLSGELDVVAFRRKALKARRYSANFLSILARAQMPQRPRLALSLAQMGLDMAPLNPLAKVGLARIQAQQGLYDEAISLMKTMVESPGFEKLYLVDYAEILSQAGRADEALRVAEEVVEYRPKVAHMQAWLAHFYWMKGQHDQSLELLHQAKAEDRLNPYYSGMIRSYEKQLEPKSSNQNPLKKMRQALSKGLSWASKRLQRP